MRAGLKEFLHFKHGKESNNINHFPGVYSVAYNVQSTSFSYLILKRKLLRIVSTSEIRDRKCRPHSE